MHVFASHSVQVFDALLAFRSDTYDLIVPHISHLTWRTRLSTPLFLFLLFTAGPLTLVPIRLLMFLAGITMFTLTHPFVRHHMFDPNGALQRSFLIPYLEDELRRLVNEARLTEEHIPLRGEPQGPGESL